MFDYGSYQWNNRNRANLIYWRGLVIVGNELKNSYSSLSLRQVNLKPAEFQRVFFLGSQVVPKSSPQNRFLYADVH